MATIRVKFRASSVDTREGTLFFQVIHNRVARQISTGYKLYSNEWDKQKGEAVYGKGTDQKRKDYLSALNADIKQQMAVLEGIVARLGRDGNAFTVDDIVRGYNAAKQEGGFLSFARRLTVHYRKAGRQSAADKLNVSVRSLGKFIGKDDIPFDDLVSDLMEEYEGWLKGQGLCLNTVSFYMRTLRSAYNIAVERDLTVQRKPFKHVYTEVDKTVKRALPQSVIRKIHNLDLSARPCLDFARNLLMFSLFLRGMSFVDMCRLKKGDLVDGVLSYRRQKTHQLLQVKWEKPMDQLLDQLGKAQGDFLLPIITDDDEDERRQCRNALHNVNRNLKKIGEMIGLDTPLTTYVARHSWASLAQKNNVPISVISEGLGHESETTTRIYLASLTSSAVDKANSKILKLFARDDK